jgi:hypothetical protein
LKYFRHTLPFELRRVVIWNNSADDHLHICHIFLAQKLHHAGNDGVVGTREN